MALLLGMEKKVSMCRLLAKLADFFSEWEIKSVPDYVLPPEQTGHAGIIREFLECIRDTRSPETVCTDNVRSLAMVLCAIDSAESGRQVKIEV
jgi:predicted dehydrogenase